MFTRSSWSPSPLPCRFFPRGDCGVPKFSFAFLLFFVYGPCDAVRCLILERSAPIEGCRRKPFFPKAACSFHFSDLEVSANRVPLSWARCFRGRIPLFFPTSPFQAAISPFRDVPSLLYCHNSLKEVFFFWVLEFVSSTGSYTPPVVSYENPGSFSLCIPRAFSRKGRS